MKKASKTILLLTILLFSPLVESCTRVLIENKYGILIGRNMDWSDWEKANYKIIIFPRGEERSGGTIVNPLTWKSRYGSLVVSMYDYALAEGINEKGLSSMVLYLSDSDFGERMDSKKGIFMPIWNQFFLDNFATVKEAVNYWQENKDNIQIVSTALPFSGGYPVKLHVALQDSTGDSAFIEYTQGELNIYHGKEFKVMTNHPPYPEQIKNLKQFKNGNDQFKTPPNENLKDKSSPLNIFEPNSINGYLRPKDRFVRASYYLSLAEKKEPEDYKQHLSQMRGIMGNVAQLLIPSEGIETDRTNYTTLTDLTNMKFYMSMIPFNNLVSVDIDKLKFEEGLPILYFEVDKINSHGDITNNFKPLPENGFIFANELNLSL